MNRDLHIVIEAKHMRDGTWAYRAVSPEISWFEAQTLWNEYDEARNQGMHEHYFMVRSADDPRWVFLVRPVVRRGRDAAVDATKDWGRAQGYEGRSGGWIYDLSGRIVNQGWWSLKRYVQQTKGIRQTSLPNGKLAWYSAKPEFQFEEDRELVSA